MIAMNILLLCLLLGVVASFRPLASRGRVSSLRMMVASPDTVDMMVPMGDGYAPLECTFRRVFEKSTFFITSYDVPFGLNIDKPPKGCPAPIVTKDGKAGEKAGDLLRATTCWSQGFSAAGVTSDIAMFAGNVKWRKSVFDTTLAPWQQIVDALLSNTAERSQTVTLVFEREVVGDEEPAAPAAE